MTVKESWHVNISLCGYRCRISWLPIMMCKQEILCVSLWGVDMRKSYDMKFSHEKQWIVLINQHESAVMKRALCTP